MWSKEPFPHRPQPVHHRQNNMATTHDQYFSGHETIKREFSVVGRIEANFRTFPKLDETAVKFIMLRNKFKKSSLERAGRE